MSLAAADANVAAAAAAVASLQLDRLLHGAVPMGPEVHARLETATEVLKDVWLWRAEK